MNPSIAIVILNWNGKHWLEKFLPSVVAYLGNNQKIIVGDNASTDDSISFLKNNYPTVEIIQNTTNQGFAGGYDTILKQVTADYYILLNSDVEVTANWIEPIISWMESDEKLAACQPKIRSFNEKVSLTKTDSCFAEAECLIALKKTKRNTTIPLKYFGLRVQHYLSNLKYITK